MLCTKTILYDILYIIIYTYCLMTSRESDANCVVHFARCHQCYNTSETERSLRRGTANFTHCQQSRAFIPFVSKEILLKKINIQVLVLA